MDNFTRQMIEAIHAEPAQLVLAVTGGGASAVGELLAVPGGSRTVLEACVPYSGAALADWLSDSAEQACSETTARAMAMAALERARRLTSAQRGLSPAPARWRGSQGDEEVTTSPLVGIGATAALASDRPKRGDHRIHVAWQTSQTTASLSLTLEKGARDRAAEETLACRFILVAIAEAMGLEPTLELELRPGEQIVRNRVDAAPEWQALARGERQTIERNCTSIDGRPVLFPGAFNPLHEGHRLMANAAEQLLGQPAVFELSIANVDKWPLDYVDIDERVKQFDHQPLVLTRAATFVEKAKLYPGAMFVVGADTIERIGDAKYYTTPNGDPEANRDAVLGQLGELGCNFLVFGRALDGSFQTLNELDLPRALQQLCEAVPETVFRSDVSSTELRRQD